jgi:hypothetical protein
MAISAIPRLAVQSSSLASIGHSADENALVIEFRNGSIYRYVDVPAQTYDALLHAESKGGYFNRFIRSRFVHERVARNRGD